MAKNAIKSNKNNEDPIDTNSKTKRSKKRKSLVLTGSNLKESEDGEIILKKPKTLKTTEKLPEDCEIKGMNLTKESNLLKKSNQKSDHLDKETNNRTSNDQKDLNISNDSNNKTEETSSDQLSNSNKSCDEIKKDNLSDKSNNINDQDSKLDDSFNKLIKSDDYPKINQEGQKLDEYCKLDEQSKLAIQTYSPSKDLEIIRIDFLNLPERAKGALESFALNFQKLQASFKELNEKVIKLESQIGSKNAAVNFDNVNIMKGDELVRLHNNSTKYISQSQLKKAKKTGVVKKFCSKIFSSVVNLTDIYRKTYSGRCKIGSKTEFSKDLVEEFVRAAEYQLGCKCTEDMVKDVIIQKLSAFNLLFNKLKNKEVYTKELVQKCKLSEDDVVYLKDFNKYIKNISLFDVLDKDGIDKTELKLEEEGKTKLESKEGENEKKIKKKNENEGTDAKDKFKVKNKQSKKLIEESDEDSDYSNKSDELYENSSFENDSEFDENFGSEYSEKLKKLMKKEIKKKKMMKRKEEKQLKIKKLEEQLKKAKKSLDLDI